MNLGKPYVSLIGQANQAFRQGRFSDALQIYRAASISDPDLDLSVNVDLCLARYAKLQSSLAAHALRESESPDSTQQFKYADRIRVALIADEFTANSFSDEFVAIPIFPHNWEEAFECLQPEIFFCESAWSGSDSINRPWKGRIYASVNFAKENRSILLDIIAYCRKQGIPTIFWNKEDPAYFGNSVHDFAKTSTEFDFVFTTAAECVESYRLQYDVRTVFTLPFATNPRLFHPFSTSDVRSSRIVFAGSWYANHEQRCKDMDSVCTSLLDDGFELEIFDRYHGDPDPLHQWPDRYTPYLFPGRPHETMPAIYKSSRYGLSFNTVTKSPTMFARRVFELMSSRTLVISNYSQGTSEMFGDLIIYPEQEKGRLKQMTENEIDHIRDVALSKVLSKHTYRHRWMQVLDNIGYRYAKRRHALTFACLLLHRDDALSALSWFQQNHHYLTDTCLLLIVGPDISELDSADIYRDYNQHGVGVASSFYLTNYAHLDFSRPIETSHFLGFSVRSLPPGEWLKRIDPYFGFATELPMTPATEEGNKYRVCLSQSSAPIVDLRDRFWSWIQAPSQSRLAYHL